MTFLDSILWISVAIVIKVTIEFLIVPRINKFAKYTPIYNGINPATGFETWNGIGVTLLGAGFRKDSLNDSEVMYAFFCVIIPLFPIDCYRVKEIGSDSFGGGYIQENTTKYKIYGKEKWQIHEIILLYITIACSFTIIIFSINILIKLYEMIDKT